MTQRHSRAPLRRGWLLALVAGAALAPAAVESQEQTPPPPPPQALAQADAQPTTEGRTHIVKKGDTLWDLARAYLSDPFQWPEIYRINTDVVEDPHWIYPGEELRIPGALPAGQAIEEPRIVDDEEPPAGPTIFQRASSKEFGRRPSGATGLDGNEPRVTLSVEEPRTAVRAGEFHAAPWFDRDGGPRNQGEVVATADIPGIAQASDRLRLQPHERIYVTLPESAVPTKGKRYLVYSLGPVFGGAGRVVLPTGIVEVESPGNGDATKVRVVQQFDEIKVGQGVMVLESFSMPLDVRPSPVELGAETRVIWVPSEAVQPSLQHYVMLGASSRDGVKLGDQFKLYRKRQRAENGVMLPEERIAVVQIVRVTDRGSTGIVIDVTHPAIRIGALARMSAKMP